MLFSNIFCISSLTFFIFKRHRMLITNILACTGTCNIFRLPSCSFSFYSFSDSSSLCLGIWVLGEYRFLVMFLRIIWPFLVKFVHPCVFWPVSYSWSCFDHRWLYDCLTLLRFVIIFISIIIAFRFMNCWFYCYCYCFWFCCQNYFWPFDNVDIFAIGFGHSSL